MNYFEIEIHTNSYKSRVTLGKVDEIDKLDVNFCQSRDFFITLLYFILYIDVTHWGIMIGVVPVKIAGDVSITSVSNKIHKNFLLLKIANFYLKSLYYLNSKNKN